MWCDSICFSSHTCTSFFVLEELYPPMTIMMMTSMLLRFLLLPFDTVNYACGLVGVPLLPYAAGTALGVLPGVVTFAIFGGAWDDPRAIAVSALVFGGSIAFAAVLKKRGLVG